jgi:hypothetical protein
MTKMICPNKSCFNSDCPHFGKHDLMLSLSKINRFDCCSAVIGDCPACIEVVEQPPEGE